MKRFLGWLFALPVFVVLLVFAIVNRQSVTVLFDPFETGGKPIFDVTAPLFVVLFAALAVGVVAGGIATWFVQGRYRRAAREARRDAARWQAEAEALRGRARETSTTTIPALRNRSAA